MTWQLHTRCQHYPSCWDCSRTSGVPGRRLLMLGSWGALSAGRHITGRSPGGTLTGDVLVAPCLQVQGQAATHACCWCFVIRRACAAAHSPRSSCWDIVTSVQAALLGPPKPHLQYNYVDVAAEPARVRLGLIRQVSTEDKGSIATIKAAVAAAEPTHLRLYLPVAGCEKSTLSAVRSAS
jgi:hypothetical protein